MNFHIPIADSHTELKNSNSCQDGAVCEVCGRASGHADASNLPSPARLPCQPFTHSHNQVSLDRTAGGLAEGAVQVFDQVCMSSSRKLVEPHLLLSSGMNVFQQETGLAPSSPVIMYVRLPARNWLNPIFSHELGGGGYCHHPMLL